MIDCISNEGIMRPFLFIVMGVSGSGKSTIAHQLAKLNSFHYVEADDYHTEQAKQKMAKGIALDDNDRLPWIDSMCITLETLVESKTNCFVAYSGLKKHHRDRFRRLGYQTSYIHLVAGRDKLASNIKNRGKHFFNAKLLDSQLAAMQSTQEEKDVFKLNLRESIEATLVDAQSIVLNAMNKK